MNAPMPSFETALKRLLRTRSELAGTAEAYAASTRRKPFHIAVAAPEVRTGRMRASWKLPLSETRGSAVR